MSDEPQLWARNDGTSTITYNDGNLNWELPPPPDLNFIGPLPWVVAISSGFLRYWNYGQGPVTVATDPQFEHPISELPDGPGGLSPYRPFVYTQNIPQAVTPITHNLNRVGPVRAEVTSIDGSIGYEFVNVDVVDANTCRISFDDPTSFLATIF